MELFTKGASVKLRSYHDKYLVADEDQRGVRQSRKEWSRQAVWTVERLPRKPNIIRLKSCYGKYLTATETPFLLGMTGEKVTQTAPFRQAFYEYDWEPIRDEDDHRKVRLLSWDGKFLRANGGAPPWKNSVTHDQEPHTYSATRKWILWFVELVKNPETAPLNDDRLSPASSFGSSVSSAADHGSGLPSKQISCSGSTVPGSQSLGSNPGSPESVASSTKKLSSFDSSGPTVLDPGSPVSVSSRNSTVSPASTQNSKQGKNSYGIDTPAIEFFLNAKAVRLRSVHHKYLIADDDEETVTQGRNGSSGNARWAVEHVSGSTNVIRLKSCHGTYLTASNERFLLGSTGRKVVQSRTRWADTAVEWEPVKEGLKVKLKSRRGGQYLRANGGPPPWKNSITCDTPSRTVTQDWVVWEVDVVEII